MIEHFKVLPHPRVARAKDHDLIDILVIAICTLLCAVRVFRRRGGFRQSQAGLAQNLPRLAQRHSQPHTFNRVFADLGPRVSGLFSALDAKPARGVEPEIVALARKALRRALDGWDYAFLLRLLGVPV